MDKKITALLPQVLTFTSLSLAWLAIVLLLKQSHYSFVCIVLAFIVDSLDGTMARYLKVESQMGRQLDSLADTFIYLFYPALVYYFYFGLADPVSIAVQLIFLATGIYRLARFNDIGYVTWKGIKGYPGLPVVFSHLVIFLLLVFPTLRFSVVANGLILLHSVLMVQRFPFPRPKTWLIVLLLVLGLAIAWSTL